MVVDVEFGVRSAYLYCHRTAVFVFCFSRINLVDIGVNGMLCGVSDSTCIASLELPKLFIESSKCTIASVVSNVSTAKSRGSSSSGVVLKSLVVSREKALAARSFIPAQWTTPMAIPRNKSFQRES